MAIDIRLKDMDLQKWSSKVHNNGLCKNYRIFKTNFVFENYLCDLDFSERRLLIVNSDAVISNFQTIQIDLVIIRMIKSATDDLHISHNASGMEASIRVLLIRNSNSHSSLDVNGLELPCLAATLCFTRLRNQDNSLMRS